MIETREREIDGVLFRVNQLPFTKARTALVRLTKAVGPGLAQAMDSSPSLASVSLTSAVSDIIGRVGDADLEYFAETFGACSEFSIDGGDKWPRMTKPNQEELFRGRLMLFFRWLGFALEVNYEDFFGALKAGLGADLQSRAPAA